MEPLLSAVTQHGELHGASSETHRFTSCGVQMSIRRPRTVPPVSATRYSPLHFPASMFTREPMATLGDQQQSIPLLPFGRSQSVHAGCRPLQHRMLMVLRLSFGNWPAEHYRELPVGMLSASTVFDGLTGCCCPGVSAARGSRKRE